MASHLFDCCCCGLALDTGFALGFAGFEHRLQSALQRSAAKGLRSLTNESQRRVAAPLCAMTAWALAKLQSSALERLHASSRFFLHEAFDRGQRHRRGAHPACRVPLQARMDAGSHSWLGKSRRRGANPSRRRGRGVVFAENCCLLQHSEHCLPRRSLEKEASQGEQNQWRVYSCSQ